MWHEFLANPGNIPTIAILAVFSVGAVAVVMGTLTQIVKTVVKHRERMAKIEQGIDPDADPPKSVTP